MVEAVDPTLAGVHQSEVDVVGRYQRIRYVGALTGKPVTAIPGVTAMALGDDTVLPLLRAEELCIIQYDDDHPDGASDFALVGDSFVPEEGQLEAMEQVQETRVAPMTADATAEEDAHALETARASAMPSGSLAKVVE